MRCAVCANPVGIGALVLSICTDQVDTVVLCTKCRHELFGREVDNAVARLVRLKGWVQPRLPGY